MKIELTQWKCYCHNLSWGNTMLQMEKRLYWVMIIWSCKWRLYLSTTILFMLSFHSLMPLPCKVIIIIIMYTYMMPLIRNQCVYKNEWCELRLYMSINICCNKVSCRLCWVNLATAVRKLWKQCDRNWKHFTPFVKGATEQFWSAASL